LILSIDPTLTPAEVRQIIRDGASDLGSPGFDWVSGYGRIDVINSLSLVQAGPPDPCGNGICETGEDCNSCAADCGSGGGDAICGDGICQPGEDCQSCPDDCRGKLNGRVSKQYCCGLDVDCSDPRCNEDPWVCSDASTEPYCCGDGTCSGNESACSCSVDCGDPFAFEFVCNDGIDDDCDMVIDCDDPDCTDDPGCSTPPPPACAGTGESCTSNEECCSNKCLGKPGSKTCK
jgi:hypothetical protein